MSTPPVVLQTDLPGLKLLGRGKVRDIYDLGENLLIVATDRLSAFDYVLPDPIPDKGKVLNQTAEFWFERFGCGKLNLNTLRGLMGFGRRFIFSICLTRDCTWAALDETERKRSIKSCSRSNSFCWFR